MTNQRFGFIRLSKALPTVLDLKKIPGLVPILCLLSMAVPLQARAATGTASVCNSNPAQPSGYAQKQEDVFYAPGLDYRIATVSCPWTTGNVQCQPTLSITLPAGAMPVTAFMWVEAYRWNGGVGEVITGNGVINGHNLGAVTPAGATVPFSGWMDWASGRWGVPTADIGGPGTTNYTADFNTGFPDANNGSNRFTLRTFTIMVLFIDPAQIANTNAVAINDGNNVWHIENDGTLHALYGAVPPDSRMNWSCAGLSCANNPQNHFSAVGGNETCGHPFTQDELHPYGGGAPIWTSGGNPLDCATGPDQIAKLRNYTNLGAIGSTDRNGG